MQHHVTNASPNRNHGIHQGTGERSKEDQPLFLVKDGCETLLKNRIISENENGCNQKVCVNAYFCPDHVQQNLSECNFSPNNRHKHMETYNIFFKFMEWIKGDGKAELPWIGRFLVKPKKVMELIRARTVHIPA
jgi:hypothetical protein